MQLRFVGISGSPQKGRSTAALVRYALEAAERRARLVCPAAEVSVDLIDLGGKKIHGCIDCGACKRRGSLCVLKDDWLEAVHPLLTSPPPDGLIIGSPVYFHSTAAQLRAFFERFTCLFKGVWYENCTLPVPDWSNTTAGAISVGAHRNGGQEEAISNIISFLLSCGFLIAGSCSAVDGPLGYTGGAAWSGIPENTQSDRLAINNDTLGLSSVELLGKRIGQAGAYLRLGQNGQAASL